MSLPDLIPKIHFELERWLGFVQIPFSNDEVHHMLHT